MVCLQHHVFTEIFFKTDNDQVFELPQSHLWPQQTLDLLLYC